jgi:ABC-type glycerol-3-phosphate transport system permease component
MARKMKLLQASRRFLPRSGRGDKQVRLSRSRAGNFGILAFMLLVCVFMALPPFYSVIQAFKPIDEIFAYPPRFFVRNPTAQNFRDVFMLAGNLWVPFSRYVFNSLFVSIGGTALYVMIASLAAYPLAKGRFRGKALLSRLIVWMMLFTADVTMIPRYIVISELGMIDSYSAIILPVLSATMGVFLIKQYIEASMPDSTLEAARIDGANEFQVFGRIIMPGIKPAWLTVIIFTFQNLWNSNPQAYIYSEQLKELPSVMSTIAAGGIARAGAAAAVGVVMMIPPILVFIFSQSSVMETMAHSGLK